MQQWETLWPRFAWLCGAPGVPLPSAKRLLSHGASEMLSLAGKVGWGWALFSRAGGKEETLIWATSTWLRRRIQSHSYLKTGGSICPFNACCQCQVILLISLLQSYSSQLPLSKETHHHQHIHVVLLFALHARCFSFKQCIFKKTQVHR